MVARGSAYSWDRGWKMTRSRVASLRSFRPSGTNSTPTQASSNQGTITLKMTIFKLERENKRGKHFLDDGPFKYRLYDNERRLWASKDDYWHLSRARQFGRTVRIIRAVTNNTIIFCCLFFCFIGPFLDHV